MKGFGRGRNDFKVSVNIKVVKITSEIDFCSEVA